MKKHLIILMILTNLHSIFCQKKINKVEYVYNSKSSFISNEKIKDEKDTSLKKSLEVLNSSLKSYENKIIFNLIFNNHESIYSMNKILNIDFDRQLIYAIALTKGKDIIYSNLKSRTILRKVSTLGEEFNIKSSMDSIKWELTQEQKK